MKHIQKLFVLAATFFAASAAFAQDAATVAANETPIGAGLVAIGAGLAIGIGVYGGTSAQGNAASKALEGISRNPAATDRMFVPLILSLALIESLVILSFIIAFLTIPGLK